MHCDISTHPLLNTTTQLGRNAGGSTGSAAPVVATDGVIVADGRQSINAHAHAIIDHSPPHHNLSSSTYQHHHAPHIHTHKTRTSCCTSPSTWFTWRGRAPPRSFAAPVSHPARCALVLRETLGGLFVHVKPPHPPPLYALKHTTTPNSRTTCASCRSSSGGRC